MLLYYILIVLVLAIGVKADPTSEELEQKINDLDKLEQNLEIITEKVGNLEEELEKRINISEVLEKKIDNKFEKLESKVSSLEDELEESNNISGDDTLEHLEKKVNNLTKFKQNWLSNLSKIEQKITDSESEITSISKQLEYGGKNFQKFQYNSALQLRDHDYLKLQLLGARDAWLGCPADVCDLRTCPSYNNNYRNFKICWGEVFQIISEGTNYSPIKSGQRIRLHYLRDNSWMGCSLTNCDKRSCPGTTLQASDFSRCGEEMFRIYARGKRNGEIVYNGDVVMLYTNAGRYVSIQGKNYGDDTSINFCPGIAPPAYLSYGICSKNAFRIYRKP